MHCLQARLVLPRGRQCAAAVQGGLVLRPQQPHSRRRVHKDRRGHFTRRRAAPSRRCAARAPLHPTRAWAHVLGVRPAPSGRARPARVRAMQARLDCAEAAACALPCKASTHQTRRCTSRTCRRQEQTSSALWDLRVARARRSSSYSPGTVQPGAGKPTCDKCVEGADTSPAGQATRHACEPGSRTAPRAPVPLTGKEGSCWAAPRSYSRRRLHKDRPGPLCRREAPSRRRAAPAPSARRWKGACLPCAASSFTSMSGLPPQVPAGWHRSGRPRCLPAAPGTSGLRDFSECEDVPPGFYAQAGSITPKSCPSWGFCPGRRADQENDEPGSIPIVLPEGQRTTTVTKVVEQVINQTVLELPLQVEVADGNAFNETAVRLRVATC